MQSIQHSSGKSCKIISSPLSARSLSDGPYRRAQCLVKFVATSRAGVVLKDTALANFEKRLAMYTNAVLPLFDSLIRPKVLILTYVSSSVTGNNFISVAGVQTVMHLRAQKVIFSLHCMRTRS